MMPAPRQGAEGSSANLPTERARVDARVSAIPANADHAGEASSGSEAQALVMIFEA